MTILLAAIVAIVNAAGVQTASISNDAQVRTVHVGAQTVTGNLKESGKWKWHAGSGPVMFETKPEPHGFKLRLADGKLRWKVKITDTKIEISDNEQNANAYELRRDSVVAPGGRVIGSVAKTEVKDASGKVVYRVIGGPPCACYGVLLLDRIPDLHRYIILSQLLAAGR